MEQSRRKLLAAFVAAFAYRPAIANPAHREIEAALERGERAAERKDYDAARQEIDNFLQAVKQAHYPEEWFPLYIHFWVATLTPEQRQKLDEYLAESEATGRVSAQNFQSHPAHAS